MLGIFGAEARFVQSSVNFNIWISRDNGKTSWREWRVKKRGERACHLILACQDLSACLVYAGEQWSLRFEHLWNKDWGNRRFLDILLRNTKTTVITDDIGNEDIIICLGIDKCWEFNQISRIKKKQGWKYHHNHERLLIKARNLS